MDAKELVREIAMLVTSAEMAELAARLGGDGHPEALAARVRRALELGADPDDVAGLVDAGRRAGALLAAVDLELPAKDPAAELCRIGAGHVRRHEMAQRVDALLAEVEP